MLKSPPTSALKLPTANCQLTTGCAAPPRNRAAYTLIELISVTALAILLIGIAVGAYHLWTQGSSVDAAQQQLLAQLSKARSFALARNQETRFIAINSNRFNRCFTILESRPTPTNDWYTIATTNRLPKYISLTSEFDQHDHHIETHLYFNPDGSLKWSPSRYGADNSSLLNLRLILRHDRDSVSKQNRGGTPHIRYIDISRLSGLPRLIPPSYSEETRP